MNNEINAATITTTFVREMPSAISIESSGTSTGAGDSTTTAAELKFADSSKDGRRAPTAGGSVRRV